MRRTAALVAVTALAALAACGSNESGGTYRVPIGDSPVRGPSEAWVTIVEFADFQCPYCARVQPTLDQIRQVYGDDVRLVFKHMPLRFHERAVPAALAAECASEQGRFWQMHDLLFQNQPAFSDGQLRGYAERLDLDLGRFDACTTSAAAAERVESDASLARELRVPGTPAFFVNGRLIDGAVPFEDFAPVIDEALERARSSGIAKDQYYEKAVLGR